MDSIWNQSFSDYEVILLDDCSTDESGAFLMEQSKNEKVTHCIINEENSGNPFAQWEKGISLASGEYIWIAESDDYCDSSFLEKMVAILDSHTDVSYALAGSHIIDSDGNSIMKDYDKWGRDDNDGLVHLYQSDVYLKHFLLWYNASYNASMIVFRKSACKQCGMDFKGMRYCGDWLFWIKMSEVGRVACLHERLNYFRRHPQSVTIRSDRNMAQLLEKISIFKYLWSNHSFGKYRRMLSAGLLYKEIKRSKIDEKEAQMLLRNLTSFGVKPLNYCFERIIKTLNQVLPFLPSPKADYVSGVKEALLIGRI